MNNLSPKPPVDEDTGRSSLAALNDWVAQVAALTTPDAIHWCDGSDSENAALITSMEADGTLIRLDEKTNPGSWLARSQPGDGARVEHLTFVCFSWGAREGGSP